MATPQPPARAMARAVAREISRTARIALGEIGLAQEGPEHPVDLPVAIAAGAAQLLKPADGVLEEVDGLARMAALEVGRAEPAGGARLGDRVGRQLDGSPAGRDGEIGIAHDRVDPTDRPRRVGLKPRLADGLAEGAHAVQDLEGGAEVADVQQVEGEDAERLAQPPALVALLEQGDRLAALGDALARAADHVALPRERIAGLAHGHAVAGAGRLLERAPRMAHGGRTVPRLPYVYASQK